jgi:hypothetical protein
VGHNDYYSLIADDDLLIASTARDQAGSRRRRSNSRGRRKAAGAAAITRRSAAEGPRRSIGRSQGAGVRVSSVQRSPRKDRIARMTTMTPINQKMLFMT